MAMYKSFITHPSTILRSSVYSHTPTLGSFFVEVSFLITESYTAIYRAFVTVYYILFYVTSPVKLYVTSYNVPIINLNPRLHVPILWLRYFTIISQTLNMVSILAHQMVQCIIHSKQDALFQSPISILSKSTIMIL